jgi:hypothetical protein
MRIFKVLVAVAAFFAGFEESHELQAVVNKAACKVRLEIALRNATTPDARIAAYEHFRAPGVFTDDIRPYMRKLSGEGGAIRLPGKKSDEDSLRFRNIGLSFASGLNLRKQTTYYLEHSEFVPEFIGRILKNYRIQSREFNSAFFETGGIYNSGPKMEEIKEVLKKALLDFDADLDNCGMWRWMLGHTETEAYVRFESVLIEISSRLNADWNFKRIGLHSYASNKVESLNLEVAVNHKIKLVLKPHQAPGGVWYFLDQPAIAGYVTLVTREEKPRYWIVAYDELYSLLDHDQRKFLNIGTWYNQIPENSFYNLVTPAGDSFEYTYRGTIRKEAVDSFLIGLKETDPVNFVQTPGSFESTHYGAILTVNGILPDGKYFLDEWIRFAPEVAGYFGVKGRFGESSSHLIKNEVRWYFPTTAKLLKLWDEHPVLKNHPLKFRAESRLSGTPPELFIERLALEGAWPLSEAGTSFFHDRIVHFFGIAILPFDVAQRIRDRATVLHNAKLDCIARGDLDGWENAMRSIREYAAEIDNGLVEMSLKFFAFKNHPTEESQQLFDGVLEKLKGL